MDRERGTGLSRRDRVVRDRIRDSASDFLQAGETIQAVMLAQTTGPWSIRVLSNLRTIVKYSSHAVVVVTDRRILVCRAGSGIDVPVTWAEDVMHQAPRATRIGPARGLWYRCDQLGVRLYIHRRFQADIAAADAALSRSGPTAATPAAWYPDLHVAGQQRYWDGAQWTENVAPA